MQEKKRKKKIQHHPKHVPRCAWVSEDPLYQAYHDHEWGRPLHDERALFEMLILEGMQAGLNWWVILKKRQAFRLAFDYFDAEKIAKYSAKKIDQLLENKAIIRHRLKINAVVHNAQCYLRLREKGHTLDDLLWGLVDGVAIDNPWESQQLVPSATDLSDKLAKHLKQLGFKYVGSTICYAYMQAVGVVNDHLRDCICRKD